jgi:hypothetical protein
MTKEPAKEELSLAWLSEEDLVLLNNALNEILHGPGAIDEVEFHTRTGANKSSAVALLARLSNAISKKHEH